MPNSQSIPFKPVMLADMGESAVAIEDGQFLVSQHDTAMYYDAAGARCRVDKNSPDVVRTKQTYIDVVQFTDTTKSWEEVFAFGASGLAKYYWKIGQKRKITVDGTSMCIQIVGFDTDKHQSAESGNHGHVTFRVLTNLTCKFGDNQDDRTAKTYYDDSILHRQVDKYGDELKAAIGDAAAKYIKSVTKDYLTEDSMTYRDFAFFAFSAAEVCGEYVFSPFINLGTSSDTQSAAKFQSGKYEGQIYEYYQLNPVQLSSLMPVRDVDEPISYWLRSPMTGSAVNDVASVYCGNLLCNLPETEENGLVFGFCI